MTKIQEDIKSLLKVRDALKQLQDLQHNGDFITGLQIAHELNTIQDAINFLKEQTQ